MTSNAENGISSDRIKSSVEVIITNLECSICHNILWKPVSCQSCEIPFCSSCIHQWLAINPNNCPTRCKIYIERKCPLIITKFLSQLQISCFYKSNGCTQIVPYEALDKHEIDCDYQCQQCPGCTTQILKKNFVNHKKNCPLVELTCQDCQLVYKRSEADTKHTEMICLKEKVRRMDIESKEHKYQINELTIQLNEMRILMSALTKSKITFYDLPTSENNALAIPNIYKGLQWTGIGYGHQLFLTQQHPTSGFVTSFTTGKSQHIAYFSQEASISSRDPNTPFNFVSLTVCAAWNDGLQLNIKGYRNSLQMNTHTATMLFGRPQMILLQWKNIDKIIFQPSGGTLHPGAGCAPGLHVILTQITINQID